MKKKLPIYKLVIDPLDESGVSFVALVDEPAIQQSWMAFEKVKEYKFKETQKQMLSGPLMVADIPIYRRDENLGEYNVVFDAPTIEQIVLKFFKNGFNSNVNLMHEKAVKGVFMFESWIIDKKNGKGVPKGFEDLPDGSWFGTFKVDNKEVWDNFVTNGVFTGFSVEGMFKYAPAEFSSQILDELTKFIKEL